MASPSSPPTTRSSLPSSTKKTAHPVSWPKAARHPRVLEQLPDHLPPQRRLLFLERPPQRRHVVLRQARVRLDTEVAHRVRDLARCYLSHSVPRSRAFRGPKALRL